MEESDWLGFRGYPETIKVPKEKLEGVDDIRSEYYSGDMEIYLTNEDLYEPWEWVEEPDAGGNSVLLRPGGAGLWFYVGEGPVPVHRGEGAHL